jgi:hypothetical protein
MNIVMMQTGCCLFDCILCVLGASLLLLIFLLLGQFPSPPYRVYVFFPVSLVFLFFGTTTDVLQHHLNS